MAGIQTAMMVASIAGSAMSAVGAIQSGNAARQQGEYNAAVGEANARAARRDAAENKRRQERTNRKGLSRLRNNNVVSMDLLEDNTKEAALIALDIQHQGEVDAIGFQSGANLDRMRGRAAQRQGYFTAAGTLLRGAAQAGSLYNPAPKKPKTPKPEPYGEWR